MEKSPGSNPDATYRAAPFSRCLVDGDTKSAFPVAYTWQQAQRKS